MRDDVSGVILPSIRVTAQHNPSNMWYTLTTTNLLLHHTLSILKGRTFRVARLRTPQGLHPSNPDKCPSVHFSNQKTTVFNRTLLQTAERQKPQGSLRSYRQRIFTRKSKPSLTSCRTSERTGSPLPFLLPHDPSILGTRSLSNRRPSTSLAQRRPHRAGLSSSSDRYFANLLINLSTPGR